MACPQENIPVGAILPLSEPWTELSLDITGPFASAPKSQRFIVVLQDYFSKYPVCLLTEVITSKWIIQWMKEVFNYFGNPLKICSDNGPQFILEEMAEFFASRNIFHDTSPIYSPQSNGLVEVFNWYLKHGIQKFSFYSDGWTQKVDELLVHFRCTAPEHSVSPSELLFGWRLRPTWSAYNRFLLPRGRADIDFAKEKNISQLKLMERNQIARDKFQHRRYGQNFYGSIRPYLVGTWVTVKLPPGVPKGDIPRSRQLRVEKILRNWRYMLSDGKVYNARRMSRFFPSHLGDDFLMDWYDPDIDVMPAVPPPVPNAPADPILHQSERTRHAPRRYGYDEY